MRAQELISQLGLQPHPEGGHFREFFRSPHGVMPDDGRPRRSALTSIDFLLQQGEFSAWHRVRSDEVWHLLEGGPLRLWCVPPSLDHLELVTLGTARPRSDRTTWCRPAGGRRPNPRAISRMSVPPSAPVSNSPTSASAATMRPSWPRSHDTTWRCGAWPATHQPVDRRTNVGHLLQGKPVEADEHAQALPISVARRLTQHGATDGPRVVGLKYYAKGIQ